MNSLQQLEACGQAPWLDFLKRSQVESGELQTLIDRDGLKGLTSNPSIFQKSIGEGKEYTSAIGDFLATGDHSISDIYEHLAVADIKAAADLLKPVYEKTKGRDGYVSLECSPYLANDTEATLVEARRLWAKVDRPNLMIKVPATRAGIPAIRRLIGEGININVTLLFALNVYEQVVEAYVCGLEALPVFSSAGSIARSRTISINLAQQRPVICVVGWRSPAPRSLMRVTRPYSRARGGKRWQALALEPSGCCGPRPAPRTTAFAIHSMLRN